MVAHIGLTSTPFSKRIAATDLFGRAGHGEAVARIGFCVAESRPWGSSPATWAVARRCGESHGGRRHRRVVMVIDEAHLLTPTELEELRLLTN